MCEGIVLFCAYINKEQWNVSRMKKPYIIHFYKLIQVIYQKNKVCYFNKRNVISNVTTY